MREAGSLLIDTESRKLHTYVIGLHGTGKSTLLGNIILQDLARGLEDSSRREGLCLLDPHGDLLEDVLLCIPPERVDDVILFDPSDTDYPFGLNLFECPDPVQRDLVCSEVIGTFYKLWKDMWGPRMEDIIRNTTLALLENPGSTMDDIPRFLQNRDYREIFLENVTNPVVTEFWEYDYSSPGVSERRRAEAEAEMSRSTLNKVRRFLLNPLIRNIIAQPKSSINFREIMDGGKILLVNLSKGKLGEDNSALLGSVLVGKLLMAALSRADIPRHKRRRFHLFVDEFQTFTTTSFPILLSEARKYNLDLVIAHQYRDQLDDLTRGATSNAANLVAFRVSAKDALELAREFDNTPSPEEDRWEAVPVYPHLAGEKLEGEKVRETLESLPYDTLAYPDPSRAWRIKRPGRSRPYSDMQNELANRLTLLWSYRALCRFLAEGRYPRFAEIETYPLPEIEGGAEERAAQIRDNSRKHYAQRKAVVEEGLEKRREWETYRKREEAVFFD